jgi:hypothetical protein
MLVERLHQVRDHLTSLAAGREHRDGPTEQVAYRMQIAPLVRRRAGSRQPRSRPGGKPCDTRVVGRELTKVVHGTLEVVAGDLVLLQQSRNRLDPVGEALVQLGTDFLRQPVVRGVADQ